MSDNDAAIEHFARLILATLEENKEFTETFVKAFGGKPITNEDAKEFNNLMSASLRKAADLVDDLIKTN